MNPSDLSPIQQATRARTRAKEERRENVRFLWIERKLTITETAKVLGTTYRTVARDRAALREEDPSLPPAEKGFAPRREFTPDEEYRILEMLEGRAGYREVSKTFDYDEHLLAKRYPGFAMSNAERNERATLVRRAHKVLHLE